MLESTDTNWTGYPKDLSCPKPKIACPRCSQRLQCLNSCQDYKAFTDVIYRDNAWLQNGEMWIHFNLGKLLCQLIFIKVFMQPEL